MNKSLTIGLIGGAIAATAIGGFAGYQALSDEPPAVAQVIAVDAVTKTVTTPREVCSDHQVVERAPVKDQNRIAGSALGAIAGGLIGNQIGGGSGKTLATVAGAAAGGYTGNRVQQNMQESKTVTRTETRCQTVNDSREETIGYDVRYRLGEEEGVVRMDEKPSGSVLPVRDGQVVTDGSVAVAPGA